jgi:hypothetical protein
MYHPRVSDLHRLESERTWLRRAFTAVLPFPLGLGAYVMVTGLSGFWVAFGLAGAPPSEPTLDSAVRFLGANFFGMGLLLTWASRRVDERTVPIRIFVVTAVLGASARLVSVAQVGRPKLLTEALIAVELSIVALGLWQRRVANMRTRLGPP